MVFFKTVGVGAILLLGLGFFSGACGDDDDVDLDGLIEGLEDLNENDDEDDVDDIVDDSVDNDRDARRLSRAINGALADGVDIDAIIDAIEDAGDDPDDIRVEIRNLEPKPVMDDGDEDNESGGNGDNALLLQIIDLLEKSLTDNSVTAQPSTSTDDGDNDRDDDLKIISNADVRGIVDTFTQGEWEVTTYEGVTDQMVGWFKNLRDLDPAKWPTWPNVPNPLVPDFRVVECTELDPNAKPGEKCVPDGMYYGLDERNVFPTGRGAVIVPARGFIDITGDYDFGFIDCSAAETKRGCAVLLVNVGEVSTFFDDVHVLHGFSVDGKYFNGDTLEVGIWGVTSHTTAAMLNMPVIADANNGLVLNAGGSDTNAGANCSVAAGCEGVLWRVVILSGNQVLAVAETVYDK